MIKRILKALFGPKTSAVEQHPQAEDRYDLERRYKDLERRQYGGTHRRMHNNFYI